MNQEETKIVESTPEEMTDERVKQEVESLEKKIQTVKSLQVELCVVLRLKELFKEVQWTMFDSFGAATINVGVLVDGVRELQPLMASLAQLGYRRSSTYKDRDYGSIGDGTRFISLYKDGEIGNHSIELAVSFTGEVCRFIKVGEKTEDIMELQCDGEKV